MMTRIRIRDKTQTSVCVLFAALLDFEEKYYAWNYTLPIVAIPKALRLKIPNVDQGGSLKKSVIHLILMQAIDNNRECRILGKYGLLTEKRKPVALKDVSVEITISGFVAHVVSSLQYENTEDNPVEAEFTFPLDDGSAVYKFEAFVEDRHIIAECQEKDEARQTYKDAVDDGSTAMLLEEDDTAGDIFRCLVGNLPPKTVSKLVIGYVIELPVEHDGKLRFTLPVILNPRYSPNVCGLQSAQGATYVVKQKDIPYTFKLSAAVEGLKEVKAVTASQPHIEIDYSGGRKTVKVLFNEDFTFDADVRLFVEYENPYEPECLVENGDQEKSGFLAETVLMVNLFTNIDTVGTSTKGEYIFVLDRSGSMQGTSREQGRIQHAKEALLLFLKSLPVNCYFNIVSFGSGHTFLFESGSKEYTEKNLDEAISLVKKMEADMGGTEILKPLKAIYNKANLPGHPRQIFLLTDGETRNTSEVIQIVKNNCSNTRVFSFGIGDGASSALVNGVARAGNGKAEFIKDSERIQPKVVSLLKFAMQPSITDIKIGWELPTGVSAMTIPEDPSCLFNGDRLILYSLLQGNTQSQISGKVFINGKTEEAPVNISTNFFYDKSANVSSFAPLHRLAAKAQIKLLEDKNDHKEESKQQIIDLSVASNMVSKHTSFVAIDKERKLKVEGKRIRRNVPVLRCLGMTMRDTMSPSPKEDGETYEMPDGETYEMPDLPRPPIKGRAAPPPVSPPSSGDEGYDCDGEVYDELEGIAEVKPQAASKPKPPSPEDFEGEGESSTKRYYRKRSSQGYFNHVGIVNVMSNCSFESTGGGNSATKSSSGLSQPDFDHSRNQKGRLAKKIVAPPSQRQPVYTGGMAPGQSNVLSTEDDEDDNAEDDAGLSQKLQHADVTYIDPHVANSGDGMMDMICMQGFRGNWTLNSDVCKALKVDIKELKGLNISKDDDVLATLAVLVWLEVNYAGRHDEWEMIEKKALTWLKTAHMDDLTVKEKMKSIQEAVASSMKV